MRNEGLFWIIATQILFLSGFCLAGCSPATTDTVMTSAAMTDPATTDTVMTSAAMTGPAMANTITETVQEESIPAQHAQSEADWRTIKNHINTGICDGVKFSDTQAFFNFGDTVAVGVGLEDDVITTIEADAGFILSVVDEDTVSVKFYNNCGEDVTVKSLIAQLSGSNAYRNYRHKDEYLISGYGKCVNGLGRVSMKLSTGDALEAGVFKQGGKLCAVNLMKLPDTNGTLKHRKQVAEAMEKFHVTPENTLFTEGIYYPIVPVNSGEKTDVESWIELSDGLVEKDWTDAHKLYALYNWCVDNFAYDEWIIAQGEPSRTFHYEEFCSGKYFLSKTHVGVCEDFSQALAIMCRAQGIPAVIASDIGHAWNEIYIADYGRWVTVDLTHDVNMRVKPEDVTDWSEYPDKCKRYSSIDAWPAGVTEVKEFYIGNQKDMIKQGLTLYYTEDEADDDAALNVSLLPDQDVKSWLYGMMAA